MEQLDVEVTLQNIVSSTNQGKRCNKGVHVGKEEKSSNSFTDIQPFSVITKS